MRAETEMRRLLDIMAALRDRETGCAWDVEQTFATIAPYTIEEAFEVADAIERKAWDELPGELGDLLLQTVFHARMAEEDGLFDFADVARAISDKMIARHPHVFADPEARTPQQQDVHWEAAKAAERAGRDEGRVLDGVALALPALTRAVKLQGRAARVGFDWPSTVQVLDKLTEEVAELVEAHESLSQKEVTEEFGDLLFVMANLARHMKVDPEAALRATNEKFVQRFRFIEDRLAEDRRTPADSDLTEMDELWTQAKLTMKKEI